MATESTENAENTERNDCCSVKCREHFIDMPETALVQSGIRLKLFSVWLYIKSFIATEATEGHGKK
jgi:hypothetical protein